MEAEELLPSMLCYEGLDQPWASEGGPTEPDFHNCGPLGLNSGDVKAHGATSGVLLLCSCMIAHSAS
ncbi:unnamed protein product [Arctogadus glacialis]